MQTPEVTLKHPNCLLHNDPRLSMGPVILLFCCCSGVTHWHHEIGVKGPYTYHTRWQDFLSAVSLVTFCKKPLAKNFRASKTWVWVGSVWLWWVLLCNWGSISSNMSISSCQGKRYLAISSISLTDRGSKWSLKRLSLLKAWLWKYAKMISIAGSRRGNNTNTLIYLRVTSSLISISRSLNVLIWRVNMRTVPPLF